MNGFEIGERVICINDDDINGYPSPIRKGQSFIVLDVLHHGCCIGNTGDGSAIRLGDEGISIGLDNPAIIAMSEIYDFAFLTHDLWGVDLFRRAQRLETETALKAIVGLFTPTPALEDV